MKLKTGQGVNVLGEMVVDGKPHCIIKLTEPVFISNILTSLIIIPKGMIETDLTNPE